MPPVVENGGEKCKVGGAMTGGKNQYPCFRSHFWPRTRDGRLGLAALVVLFALVEPPVLYLVANRIEPSILGLPFLYAYLSVLYVALVGVLLWIQWRGV